MGFGDCCALLILCYPLQFTNPDSIKNAVKRYNLQRAAERDECKKERDTQKLTKMRFCKMRCNTNDVLGMVTSRDLDVETQMSLNTEDLAGLQGGACGTNIRDNTDPDSDTIGTGNGDCSNSNGNGFRFNIDQKIEHSLLRMHGGAEKNVPMRRTKAKVIRRRKVKSSMNMKQLLFSQEDADAYCKKIEGLHREVCAELNVMRNAHLKHEGKSKQGRLAAGKKSNKHVSNKKKIGNIAVAAGNINKLKNNYNVFEKQKKLTPQRKQPEKMALHAKAEKKVLSSAQDQDNIMKRLKQVLSVDQRMFAMQTSFMDYSQAQVQWADIIPSPTLPQIAQPIEYADGSVELFSDQCPEASQAPQPEDAYYADDSDLEQQYLDRPGYMQYVERLPYNMRDQDMSDAGATQQACFVDLDPHPQWISFKRSLKPMDYSSQRSETDTSTLCDDKEQAEQQQQQQLEEQQQQKQDVKNDARKQLARRQRPKVSNPVTPVPSGGGGKTVRSKQPTPRPKRKSLEPQATKNINRQPGGRDKQSTLPTAPLVAPPPPPTSNDKETPVAAVQNPAHMPAQRRRKPRPVVITQSLENLKYQKMLIYNRISMTQERIIGALDNLQCRLLQLQIPTNSHHDKSRRERNAFKFCVKFSRNFLFPLRGLIDDVRCTAVANYHSATSNDASQKVVCAYQLMYHAIGNYRRHLRFFLLNKVPQKVSALIEMMYTLTNVCLEKSILDRQDPVVECLQQRCTNFISFIEDMQEERFQLAHEAFRHMQRRSHGTHGHGEGGTHERYDLKMFLNDLKLYEPIIVPKATGDKKRNKELPRVRIPRKRKATNPTPSKEATMEVTREVAELQRDLPEVPTHIECVQCGDCRLDGQSTETEDVDAGKQKEQLSNILALLQHPHCERRELHQQLLEAMEHVTKSQVREVLDPLVRSLGLIINKKVMETSGANEAYFPY